MAAHVAGVAAARAASDLHARGPDEEVGGRGIHLTPGDLVDHRPRLTHCRHRLLHDAPLASAMHLGALQVTVVTMVMVVVLLLGLLDDVIPRTYGVYLQ